MEASTANTFSFDEFEIDGAKRRLLKQGKPVALNPKTFDLLFVLTENHGRVVGKDELLDRVWAGQFVEENNLTVHISALRKIFGEKKGAHQFIVTVPGKGYKFVADIKPPAAEGKEIIIESRTFSRVLIEEDAEEKAENETSSERKFGFHPQSKNREIQKTAFQKLPLIFFLVPGVILITLLAGFFFVRSDQTADRTQFAISKLTASGKISNAALTPDAKYAVFSQTEEKGESLRLRHIATGSQTQILPAKSVKYVGLTVSPDGNLIYATVFSGEMPDPQIWRVPLLGGAIEEIKNIKTGASVSLSPDGKRFAFTESRSSLKETHFGVADADGSNKQILVRAADERRAFPNFDASPVAWSPDGGEIACLVEEKSVDGAKKAGILLINQSDGSERYVSEKRWDYLSHVAWLDAETLAFTAFTLNPWHGQVWTISKKTGETRRVTNDLNNYSWLSSANDEILAVQKASVSHLRVADFDQAAKTLQPRDVLSESGYIDSAVWTNDGQILYSSSASGKREIWRVENGGANPSQLTVNADISFGMTVSPVDGSIVFSSVENNRYVLRACDRDGKNMRRLTDGAEDVFPNFAADGQTIVFQRGLNHKTLTLWSLNIADGRLIQLTQTQASHPAVSPDGTRTAYYFMDREYDNLWRVGLILTRSGDFLGKLNLPAAATERRMRWHPHGDFLTQVFYAGDDANLFLIPIGGGREQEIAGLGKGDVNWFEWSKDGSKIVVSQTLETQDIVLLKDD